MTRDEYIDDYLARLARPNAQRTPNGYRAGDVSGIALRCSCGGARCVGWGMVRDDPLAIEMHARLYGPLGDIGDRGR